MAKRHAKVQHLDNLKSMYLHTNLWVSVTVAETQYIAYKVPRIQSMSDKIKYFTY